LFVQDRIELVALLKLLIPRISMTLLKFDIVKNKTTEAPHEYAYQFELFSLLQWALRQPHLRAVDHRVVPEAKDYEHSNQRADIVIVNHGRYVIEIGAHMSPKNYDEHYERTINYVNTLDAWRGVVINFSTDATHSGYFPRCRSSLVSCLNVHVDIDGNVFNIWELQAETELSAVGGKAVLQGKNSVPRSTPLRSKTPSCTSFQPSCPRSLP
jgi:hypothetical protein